MDIKLSEPDSIVSIWKHHMLLTPRPSIGSTTYHLPILLFMACKVTLGLMRYRQAHRSNYYYYYETTNNTLIKDAYKP